jgi:hypothetical protein
MWAAQSGEEVKRPESYEAQDLRIAFSSDGISAISCTSHQPCVNNIHYSGGTIDSLASIIAFCLLVTVLTFKQPNSLSTSSVLWNSQLRNILTFNRATGWIEGPDSQLILWIPYDHHAQLMLPGLIHIVGHHPTYIHLDQFIYGPTWSQCFSC